ncbi:MAG: hypothetical protein GYB64_03140 [Chloroflexi bacterium]|nr:hypothetical protein [Chloroflexota bacterium]
MALIKGLWGIARPNQVVSVLMVFILGILGAWALGGQPAVVPVVWATAIVLLLTVSIHYVNEYADVETDSLTERTPYSGGSGVLPSGAVPRDVVMPSLGLWASSSN